MADEFPADLVTYNEQILNGKLHFLCIVNCFRILFHFGCYIQTRIKLKQQLGGIPRKNMLVKSKNMKGDEQYIDKDEIYKILDY